MPSIDERIVSISFNNAQFEKNIAQTIASLMKLNETLKLTGSVQGLHAIEQASNNVKFTTAQQSAANFKKSADFTQNATSLKNVEAAASSVKMSGAKAAADDTRSRFTRMADSAKSALNSVKETLTRSGKNAGDALQFRDAKGQFAALEQASHLVKLSGISGAISKASQGFTLLKGTAAVAFGNIAASAAAAGTRVAKSFFNPIRQGFAEYEQNINSTQTILANVKGQKGGNLKSVNKLLGELNTYADKTIYKFGDMTKGASIFTAAGVNIGEVMPAIKGVSNLLAVSGASAEKAAPFMNQMSQALASGKVGVQDWQSATAAGVSGKMFQKAIVQEAVAMGKLKGKVEGLDDPMKQLRINGMSFRDSIKAKPGEESYFTSDVLKGVFQNLSGDMTEAKLVAKGYTQEQAKAALATAKTAYASATVVKTLSGLKDTLKEAIGSGWARSFQILFGDFGEAKKLFTGLSSYFGGIIQKMAKDRNALLEGWKKLGGRKDLFTGLKAAFGTITDVIGAIKTAFRDIFPKSTSKDLAATTSTFANFATNLRENIQPALSTITRLAKGFFAGLSIGMQIVKKIIGVFFHLGGAIGGAGASGFKEFAFSISGFLVALDRAMKSGASFTEILGTFPAVIRAPIQLIQKLASAFTGFFSSKFGGKEFGGQFDRISVKMSPLKALMEKLTHLWDAFKAKVTQVTSAIQPGIQKLKDAFSSIGQSLVNAFNNADYGNIISGIQAGLFGGLILMFKKFFQGGLMGAVGGKAGLGMFSEIGKSFGALTGYLKAMQMQVQANILLKIAIALGILTLSILALSSIPAKELDRSMSALVIAFTQLAVATSIVTKIAAGPGALKMPILAAGMILLAVAMRILVSSVKALAKLDMEQLKKGLGGVAVLFALMAASAVPLGAAGAKIVFAGAGMILIATAMRILVKAIVQLSALSWEDLGKGLATMGGALLVVAAAATAMPLKLPLVAAGMILFAVALRIMVKVIEAFASLSFKEIARGLIALAGALAIIVVAVALLPATLALQAAGMLILAVAIRSLAKSLIMMSALSPEKMLTSLIGLGGALTILAAGLYAMNSGIVGAAALFIAAKGLQALVPAILTLGTMPISQLIQGLGAIVIGFAALAATTLILAPVIPVMVALGLAIVAIGFGVGMATTGIAKLVDAFGGFVEALAKLRDSGKGTIKELGLALFEFLHALVLELPQALMRFIVNIAQVLAKFVEMMPQMIQGFATVIGGLLNVIITLAPKISQAVIALGLGILNMGNQLIPKLIETGLRLLLALLDGLNRNISSITNMAGNIIIKFLNALSVKMPGIVDAGTNLIVKFLDGVTRAIPRIQAAVTRLIVQFALSMTMNAPKIGTAAAVIVTTFLATITNMVPRLITAGVNLVVAVLKGIGKAANRLRDAAIDLISSFISNAAKGMLTLVDRIGRVVLNFMHGLDAAVVKYEPEIIKSGLSIGKHLIEGMIKGFADFGGVLKKAVNKAFGLLPGWAKDILGIHSPSTVFAEIGMHTVQGFANGITDNAGIPKDSVVAMSNDVINGVKDTFQIQSPSKVMQQLGRFVGKGFADGLDGSREEVKTSFTNMQGKLSEAMKAARETIATEQGKLKDQLKSDKPDLAAIAASRKLIEENNAVLIHSKNAHTLLTQGLKSQKTELLGLARDYDVITEKIKAAKDAVIAAKQARDEAIKSYTEKYSALPEFPTAPDPVSTQDQSKKEGDGIAYTTEKIQDKTAAVRDYSSSLDQLRNNGASDETYKSAVDNPPESITGTTNQFGQQAIATKNVFSVMSATNSLLAKTPNMVQSYSEALTKQIDATVKYQETLQKLRTMGLDDATYKKLLEQGTAGQQFADQLLAGGPAAVASINALDAKLSAAAKTLGEQAGHNLYDAGVATAKGLVEGLKSQRDAISHEMEVIARRMVRALKNELGIKSPSRVFAEIGKFSAQGMADGLRGSAHVVRQAASDVGDAAMGALSNTLASISDRVATDIDTDLTITPVLDLTQVQKDAAKMQDLTNVTPITAAASFGQATAISSDQQAAAMAAAEAAAAAAETAAQGPTEIKLEQNNFSPKALSAEEIYRQTHNQLSQAKSALGIPKTAVA